MKKVVLVVSILLLASLCFATGFTPHENGSAGFTLMAYYKGQNQNDKAVSLTINDSSDSSIYHGATLSVSSNTEESTFSLSPIFTWVLKGEGFNSNSSISLKFTFKALMAYVVGHDMYYVPGHQFTMTTPVVSAGANSSFAVSSGSGATKMSAFSKQTGNYQYPNYNTNNITNITRYITYVGTMVPDDNQTWTVSGSCNLKFTDYSKFAGTFNYKGDVKVEFTVQ